MAGPIRSRWATWDGASTESLTLRFENGGWTADSIISSPGTHADVHYVIRLGADFDVRQLVLFRDDDEPDLWLANDGAGRWGEVNGARRDDLEGCDGVHLGCTPFTRSLPIRRAGDGVDVGTALEVCVAVVDVETLQVTPLRQRYTRMAERRWRCEHIDESFAVELDVDEHGLVLDDPERFRRLV
jgi:uncharacterized protein